MWTLNQQHPASSGNLSEMQIPSPTPAPRPSESETEGELSREKGVKR